MTLTQKEESEIRSSHRVSLFNSTVYFKFLRKGWLMAILPGAVMAVFGILMMLIWPEFEEVISDPALIELMSSPIYTVLLGGSFDMTTFQGFWAIELFTILEFLMLFLVVFIPVRLISNEVDKNTLDIALSYPIPRWQFLLQKYLVYLTQMFFIPVFLVLSALLGSIPLNETFDTAGLLLSGLGWFVLFFSLGAISLLVTTLFLESGRSLAAAGILVFGMWILDRLSGLVESTKFLQNMSIFHYLTPRRILETGEIPLAEFGLVVLIGVMALTAALYIFQKRELAYG